jgi:hypothetical protein
MWGGASERASITHVGKVGCRGEIGRADAQRKVKRRESSMMMIVDGK